MGLRRGQLSCHDSPFKHFWQNEPVHASRGKPALLFLGWCPPPSSPPHREHRNGCVGASSVLCVWRSLASVVTARDHEKTVFVRLFFLFFFVFQNLLVRKTALCTWVSFYCKVQNLESGCAIDSGSNYSILGLRDNK